MDSLQNLASQYLDLKNQSEETERKLKSLKDEIIDLAQKQKVKKIKTNRHQLLIVSQSETRFPQLGEPGRKEIEKIVREAGETQGVMVFDIITLGNLYDQKKLSPRLMEKLESFAKRTKTTKIVVKSAVAS